MLLNNGKKLFKNMKILFIAPRFHTNLYYRVKSLKDAGHDVYFLSLYKQHSECYDVLEPRVLRSSRLNKILPKLDSVLRKGDNFWKIKCNFPVRKDLKAEIKKINPDAVFIKGLQSVISLMSLWYVSKFTDKVFLLIQTDEHFIKTKKKKFLVKILKKYFKVKNIVTPLKNISDKRDDFFIYVPFIIEAIDFKKDYFKNDKINVISVGKYVKRKDQITLLKAINELKNRYEFSVTLVGEKVDEDVWNEIKDYIKNNGLEKMVKMEHNLDYKEMQKKYRESDIFILPSYNEPAAYSPVEAMAAKLPVICSDTCGTKCYVKEEENGHIFKSKDYKDLAWKLEKVISDKENLKETGARSFDVVRKRHSTDLFKNKFNKIIK